LSAFADSSFLVSLYVADVNSSAAASTMVQLAVAVLLTSLGELELEHAIQLRVFRKQIGASDQRAHAAFRADTEARILAIKADGRGDLYRGAAAFGAILRATRHAVARHHRGGLGPRARSGFVSHLR
jgi:hypothetical protein